MGAYRISDGMISPIDFLKDGQRFWITNSDLNDGVYTYHEDVIYNDDNTKAAGLSDEDFNGTICAMAVPPAVVALSGEINNWVENYGAIVSSPYSSEALPGVYSYSKAVKGDQEGGGGYSWQDVFRDRLNQWRKVCL